MRKGDIDIKSESVYKQQLTTPLCVQYMPGGGSGRCFTMQVKLIVDPTSMYMSGPPRITVTGSIN